MNVTSVALTMDFMATDTQSHFFSLLIHYLLSAFSGTPYV
jgi:hypothetical protein